jgi:hypothetical protein
VRADLPAGDGVHCDHVGGLWGYGDERGGGGGAIGELESLLVEVELLSLPLGGRNVTCLVTRLPDIYDLDRELSYPEQSSNISKLVQPTNKQATFCAFSLHLLILSYLP